MLKRSRYFALGLLLAASIGAYAVSSGGFPYFPTFGGVTVKNFFNCNKTGHVAGEGCQLVTNGTGVATQNYVGIYDQGGTRYGYFGKAGTGDGTITFDSDSILKLTGNNGTDSIIIDAAHALTYNGATLGRASFNNPKVSFGEFIGTSGGCSNNSGVWQTQNLGGTCTRNSIGNYTIAFSVAYAGSPICMAQITSALAGIAGVNTAGTTSVTVQVGTTAFAAQDAAFFLQCVGL